MGYKDRIENNEMQVSVWLPRELWERVKDRARAMRVPTQLWATTTLRAAVDRQEKVSGEDLKRMGVTLLAVRGGESDAVDRVRGSASTKPDGSDVRSDGFVPDGRTTAREAVSGSHGSVGSVSGVRAGVGTTGAGAVVDDADSGEARATQARPSLADVRASIQRCTCGHLAGVHRHGIKKCNFGNGNQCGCVRFVATEEPHVG